MRVDIAPVQGHTDAAWRHYHKKIYGGDAVYYTPFIRLEKGDFRKHDLKDWLSPLNEGIEVVPQVIFRNMEELRPLVDGLAEKGARKIDLNTGCPFPLQTARGRGAAMVGNVDEYAHIPEIVAAHPEVCFSVKMRLGFADPGEWHGVIDILNSMPLDHVTLHPRIARQQYGGEVDMTQFREFVELSRNPVVYNGDIRTPEDGLEKLTQYPDIMGLMVGRGVLGRPSLIAEIENGKEWSQKERIEKMLRFHSLLLNHYREELCGDHQVLSKIKPFWEYAEEEIGRKAWKAISKASNMAKYTTAVALIGPEAGHP